MRQLLFFIAFLSVSLHSHAWFSFFMPPMTKPEYVVTVMLDPAGDAQHTGRTIDDNFERTLTLQFAERLKMLLEEQISPLKILITRHAGDSAQPLENAMYANRVNADLYLSIHFFKEKNTKPSLYIFTFKNADLETRSTELCFLPYDKAHVPHYLTTARFAHSIKNLLTTEPYANLFECKDVTAIPFKPLIGIQAPALALEIGLSQAHDWTNYLEPIALSLQPIIKAIQKNHAA